MVDPVHADVEQRFAHVLGRTFFAGVHAQLEADVAAPLVQSLELQGRVAHLR